MFEDIFRLEFYPKIFNNFFKIFFGFSPKIIIIGSFPKSPL